MYIHVRHRTRADRGKGREQVKKDWKCPGCGAHNRYYWATCPVCSHPRPR